MKIDSPRCHILLKLVVLWCALFIAAPTLAEVGQLGDPSNIEFDGNESFSDEAIITGLIGSPAFLSASHPLAPLDDYLSVLKRSISRGYRRQGFPYAKVEVGHDQSDAQVSVKISEGPRFSQGEILVTGYNALASDEIINALIRPGETAHDPLTEAIEEIRKINYYPKLVEQNQKYVERLKGGTPSFQVGAEIESDTTWLDSFSYAKKRPCPLWGTSDFVNFIDYSLVGFEQAITNLYAKNGYPRAVVKAEYDIKDDQKKVDLILDINEGESAIIKDIHVIGNDTNTDEQIILSTGLQPGQRVTTELINNAHKALWNSARFTEFNISIEFKGEQNPYCSLLITVKEHELAPPFDSVTPQQARLASILTKFANWLTTKSVDEGFWVRIESPHNPGVSVAVAKNKGFAISFGESFTNPILAIVLENESVRIFAQKDNKYALFDGELPVGEREILIYLSGFLSSSDFSFGWGFKTKTECEQSISNDSIQYTTIVSPESFAGVLKAVSESSDLERIFQDEKLILEGLEKNTAYSLRIEEKTGRLEQLELSPEKVQHAEEDQEPSILSTNDATISIKTGKIDHIFEQMDHLFERESTHPNLKQVSFSDLIDEPFIDGVLGDAFGMREGLDGFLVYVPASIRILEETYPTLIALTTSGANRDSSWFEFSIPSDPDFHFQGNVVAIFMGPLLYQVAQMLGQSDSWLAHFGRELFYITSGLTQYSDASLDQLYNDPDMGPIGSLLIAQMLKRINSGLAWKFASRAIDHSSLEEFQTDYQLFLNQESELGRLINKIVESIADIDDEIMSAILAHIDEKDADLISEYLRDINYETDQSGEQLIQTYLDRWWVNNIKPQMETRIGAFLGGNTNADPEESVALVNGIPISRSLYQMRVTKPRFFAQIPETVIAQTDTFEIELEALILQTLVLQNAILAGYDLSDEKIDAIIEQDIQNRYGGDRKQFDGFLTREGFNYSDYRDLYRLNVIFAEMRRKITESPPMPTEAQITEAIADHINTHDIRHIQAISVTGNDITHIDQIREEIAGDGGFNAVYEHYVVNDKGDVQVYDFPAVQKSELNKNLAGPAFDLKTGEVSKVIQSGTTPFILFNVGPDSKVMHDSLRKKFIQSLNESNRNEAFPNYLKDLRSNAFVQLLEKQEHALQEQLDGGLQISDGDENLHSGGIEKYYEEAVSETKKNAEQGRADAQHRLAWMYMKGKEVKQNDIEAAKLLKKSAAQGHSNAQLDLGWMYLEGKGVEQNLDEALRWYKKAAEQGNVVAQSFLGFAYLKGETIDQNYEEAMKWLKRAAEQGYADSQRALGWMYYAGEGVDQDYEKALEWTMKAAEEGDAGAQNNLGTVFLEGNAVDKDEKEGLRWFRKAADQGFPMAFYNLGWCYQNGVGVLPDDQEALRWYRKAAEKGQTMAQVNLGAIYFEGLGIPKDYTKAFEWWKRAAEQGDLLGQVKLGMMFYEGKGVEQDYAEAIKWNRKAADKGYAQAQHNLGWMYQQGHGVAQDYTQAAEWYKKAVTQGFFNSYHNLGELYIKGLGVEQDYQEGLKWLKDAAQQGHAGSQSSLGLIYSEGEIVPEDLETALMWLKKAAEQGYPTGQYNLAHTYAEYGNYQEARKWYEKAAVQGHKGAQQNLGVLYAEGRGVERDNAKALEWFRKSAAQGNLPALNSMGIMYRDGSGVPQDYEIAVNWFRKAAELGYAPSQVNLARMYDNGTDGAQGYAENINENATTLLSEVVAPVYAASESKDVPNGKLINQYKKDAAQGDAESQYKLGFSYFEGGVAAQDYVEAAEWFRKAAQQGHSKAQSFLGYMYLSGKGVKGSVDGAFKWLSEAAIQGDAYSQYYLGKLYQEKMISSLNHNKVAARWYKRAAEQRHPEAQHELGQMFFVGTGVWKDPHSAYKWLTQAAQQGVERSKEIIEEICQAQPALCNQGAAVKEVEAKANDAGYLNRLGQQKYWQAYSKTGQEQEDTYREAAELFLKAAERGNKFAQERLSQMYYTGKGVPKDFEKASMWLEKSAVDASAYDQYEYGQKFRKGKEFPQILSEAYKWYKKAAEQGHSGAQYRLGRIYRETNEYLDIKEAFHWFKLAAERDHSRAQYFLAKIYHYGMYGVGTNPDYEKAWRWYTAAIKNGNQEAEEWFKRLCFENMTTCNKMSSIDPGAIIELKTEIASVPESEPNESSDLSPKGSRVACELPIYSVNGGSRIIQLKEADCIHKEGRIVRYIKPLPPSISRSEYINCDFADGEGSVFMKAGACLDSGGEIKFDNNKSL